jgi:bacillithiol biosynthesis deacetylase BshB1
MIDVLAIGPHPDDVELSLGGTLARLVAHGRRVGILDLTRGERATRGTAEVRAAEAEAAARALGVSRRDNLELPDGAVDARDPDHQARLVAHLRATRPALVLTLDGADDHPDHVEGADLVRRAVYLAGLRNWPAAGEEPHRAGRPLFAMGRHPFVPTLVVDVTEHYEAKRAALAAYGSQFRRDADDERATPISEPGFLAAIEGRDRHHGAMVGVERGEAFRAEAPLGDRELSWLLPGRNA